MANKSYVLILPNSLFENNELLKKYKNVIIYEHPVYFTKYNYHKLKLILHRASMKYYQDLIKKKYKSKVTYIDYNKKPDRYRSNKIYMYDPVDHIVTQNLKRIFGENLNIIDSPLFINQSIKNIPKNLKFKAFYVWNRKHHNVLMTKNNKPISHRVFSKKEYTTRNKYVFDNENRKPFIKNIPISLKKAPKSINNKYIKEAKKYINKHFKNNPGKDNIIYLPIDHKGAKRFLNNFINTKLKQFGPYEDAVNSKVISGYHSLLSPLTNIGLITPQFILDKVLKKKGIPINSLEGFVRQLLGWREYCRYLYETKRTQLTRGNYFNNKKTINKKLWYYKESKGNYKQVNKNNSTGFKVINDMLDKVIQYGYLHHIERLMYIGNYLLITRIKPKDVFEWFQSMFVDSYHVFMYPNVFGMSQYSCGNVMMTRPYLASNKYIEKMSDYKMNKKLLFNNNSINTISEIKNLTINQKKNIVTTGDIFRALYYNFIRLNKTKLNKYYHYKPQISYWNKLKKSKKNYIIKIANLYLKNY